LIFITTNIGLLKAGY